MKRFNWCREIFKSFRHSREGGNLLGWIPAFAGMTKNEKVIPQHRRIILCADDYGQNEAISQAIIELLTKKSLTAVSCLVSSKYWPSHANSIKPYINQADIGLHFNLTYEKPYSLAQLLWRCYTKTISKEFIHGELNTQLDQFIAAMGKMPDFIDGHQHVHTFPVVRDVLLDVYKKRGLECYVRSTYNKNSLRRLSLKKWFIQYQLANAFKKQLIDNNIPHNSTFSGIYDFSILHYCDLFKNFLEETDEGGLIMCHPGLKNLSGEKDEIKNARVQEWTYFVSDAFQKNCEDQNISLIRFSNNKK